MVTAVNACYVTVQDVLASKKHIDEVCQVIGHMEEKKKVLLEEGEGRALR